MYVLFAVNSSPGRNPHGKFLTEKLFQPNNSNNGREVQREMAARKRESEKERVGKGEEE